MAHRRFRDGAGREWEVWSVPIEYLERRADVAPSPRVGDERRVSDGALSERVSAVWSRGWLTFETDGEKRRLAEFPPDWAERSDAELEILRDAAVSVPASRRLTE